VTAEAPEMVTVPRAELDVLRAEVRRLRREVGRSMARVRMEADPGPGDGALILSRSELAEAWGQVVIASCMPSRFGQSGAVGPSRAESFRQGEFLQKPPQGRPLHRFCVTVKL
jgi:hypothetical protein